MTWHFVSRDVNPMMCPQPETLAPTSCPGRYRYDPALLGPGNCLAILPDSPSSLCERIASDKTILRLECQLCLRIFW